MKFKIPLYLAFFALSSSIVVSLYCTKEIQNDPDFGLQWAIRMAESVIVRNSAPHPVWKDGTNIVLRGFEGLYLITGERKYLKYIQYFMDASLTESTSGQAPTGAFTKMLGKGHMMLFLYKETANQNYRNSAELLFQQVQPQSPWEKAFAKSDKLWNKVELKDLYLGASFYAEYGKLFDKPEVFGNVVARLARYSQQMPEAGLDSDKNKAFFWSNWETPSRMDALTLGYYAMALVDVLEYLPQNHPSYESVLMTFQEQAKIIKKAQDKKSGVWWQRLDARDSKDNYPKASVSCMFTYVLAKGVHNNYLEPSYRRVAESAFQGIVRQFIRENPDGNLHLSRGKLPDEERDRNSTFSNPKDVPGDQNAIGPFIIASIEIHKLNQ